MHGYRSFNINIHILGKESRVNMETPGITNTNLTNHYVQQNMRCAEYVVRIRERRGEVHTEFSWETRSKGTTRKIYA
jgi:hypothetical protein